jgi:nicotinate-nucleotide pyrophosphorylase (carboxylating)
LLVASFQLLVILTLELVYMVQIMSIEQLETGGWQRIIDAALAEDIGSGDITSTLLIPSDKQANMLFVARETMVVCGTFIPQMVYDRLSHHVKTELLCSDGQLIAAGKALVKASGSAQTLLTGERVALNIMQRMCGVATLTKHYVDAVEGTKATILDTRKTMPGMRAIDKYAVTQGGGVNHRMGLYDAVMIKDNHIALSKTIAQAVAIARAGTSLPIIVECDTLEQVMEAIDAKPDRLLLDNIDVQMLAKAVALVAGRIPLEASGGVSLDTVRSIAQSGVDFISVGKITHSAISMDIGADIELL